MHATCKNISPELRAQVHLAMLFVNSGITGSLTLPTERRSTWAGVASAVEPKLRELQMQPGVRRHENAREDARGDALLTLTLANEQT